MNVNFGLFPEIEEFERHDPETGRRYRGKEKGRAKKARHERESPQGS